MYSMNCQLGKFLASFIAELTNNGVFEADGLVEQWDPREIRVLTEQLTSSEAEAVVKAMEVTLIAPIKIRGEVIYEDGQIEHVSTSFTSAKGGRRVVLQRWDSLIGEALRRNPNFVLANLGSGSSSGEEDFVEWISGYVGRTYL